MNIRDIAQQVCNSLEGFYGPNEINECHAYGLLQTGLADNDDACLALALPDALDILQAFGCEDVDALQSMLHVATAG